MGKTPLAHQFRLPANRLPVFHRVFAYVSVVALEHSESFSSRFLSTGVGCYMINPAYEQRKWPFFSF